MLRSVSTNPEPGEGYVYVVYGSEKYLQHAVASVVSLRRYETKRKVALVCEHEHRVILERHGLTEMFDIYVPLSDEHRSIVGFKHNMYQYMVFEKNLFLDSDIIWCKSPDPLWESFSPYEFTITGNLVSDSFFGSTKGIGIIKDVILNRRQKTLQRFGLTYLSRVQSGMIYARDHESARRVCLLASEMLNRKSETHFKSRTFETGRNEESCEWSLAMAMSTLSVPVYPWLQGQTSPQLDFIEDWTDFDSEFEYVSCTYYNKNSVYAVRGIKTIWLRNLIVRLLSMYPGNGDFMKVTPYCIHFGWYHQKQPFNIFSDLTWKRLTGMNKGNEKMMDVASDAFIQA
jgi:hypothetical protein